MQRGLRAGSAPPPEFTSPVEAPPAPRNRAGRAMRAFALSAMTLATGVLMSGCSLFSSPQNVFAPNGVVADDQRKLFFITLWPALAIMILVEGLIVYMVIRFRRRKTDTALPPQVHGNNRLEIAWTIAPIFLLALFVVPVISGIVDLAKHPKGAVEVEVTGVQWAWLFAYDDPKGGAPIAAGPGEALHVPVDEDVYVRLHSNNVIHSFWVPKLAGKTDVVPSRTNHMWFRATDIGTYSGQCAEFCGLQHSDMRFDVIVESRADYDAYIGALVAAQGGGGGDELARQGD